MNNTNKYLTILLLLLFNILLILFLSIEHKPKHKSIHQQQYQLRNK